MAGGQGGQPDGIQQSVSNPGQVIILVAILIIAVLTLLALILDGGRLLIERSRMRGAAQAAADAGLGPAAEAMVTLMIPRQTEAAGRPACQPDGEYGDQGASCTATPPPNEMASWLTDEDRETLRGETMQTQVAGVAGAYAQRNGYEPAAVAVEYPYHRSDHAAPISIRVVIRRQMVILMAGLLGPGHIPISAEALSEIAGR
jgi:hypothetical protein